MANLTKCDWQPMPGMPGFGATVAEHNAAARKRRGVRLQRRGGIYFFRLGRVSGSLSIAKPAGYWLATNRIAAFVAGAAFSGIAL